MKLTIDQSVMADGLNQIQSAVSNRPTIAVLNNVLLSAENNELTLTATDLDLSVTTKVPCTVERAGKTTLPAKKLGQIIRQLPHNAVTIDTNENQVSSISCQQSFFKILGISHLDFPVENDPENTRVLTLGSEDFRKMLDKISYSVSTDETRLVLNGILLSIREGTLTAVATDGRRLALIEKVLDTDDVLDGDTILPSKAIGEIQKVLNQPGEVRISLGDSKATFETNNTILKTKLVEGNYPNYRQVIPHDFTEMIEIPREDLSKAISRVAVILTDSASSVRVAMESESVLVSAFSNADESSESVPVNYMGEAMTISLNPGFIQEPLKRLECNNVTLRFNDKTSPIGVFGDEGFLYIIMPMRN